MLISGSDIAVTMEAGLDAIDYEILTMTILVSEVASL